VIAASTNERLCVFQPVIDSFIDQFQRSLATQCFTWASALIGTCWTRFPTSSPRCRCSSRL